MSIIINVISNHLVLNKYYNVIEKMAVKRMIRDRRGSITVYTALFLAAGISAGTLAIDVGRMTVLRSEMQNRADSAAMAGAVQLDGRAGARARALAVASNAATEWSALPSGGGDLARIIHGAA